jgi:type II secretion system protein I
MRGSTSRWTGSPGASPSTTGRRRRRGDGERGFTLLEVLIAFAILAVMLVPLLQVFGGGLGTAESARAHALATLLARSKLAEVGADRAIAEGEDAGDFAERGYRWRTSIVRDETEVIPPEDEVDLARGTVREKDRRGGTGRGESAFGRSSSSSSSGFGQGSSGSTFGNRQSGSSFGGQSRSSFGGQSRSSFGSGQSGSSFGGQSGSSFGRRSGFSEQGSGFSRQRSGFGDSAQGGAQAGERTQAEAAGEEGGFVDTSNELLPYRVTVTVEWTGEAGEGSVSLSSLRLARAIQPEQGAEP